MNRSRYFTLAGSTLKSWVVASLGLMFPDSPEAAVT